MKNLKNNLLPRLFGVVALMCMSFLIFAAGTSFKDKGGLPDKKDGVAYFMNYAVTGADTATVHVVNFQTTDLGLVVHSISLNSVAVIQKEHANNFEGCLSITTSPPQTATTTGIMAKARTDNHQMTTRSDQMAFKHEVSTSTDTAAHTMMMSFVKPPTSSFANVNTVATQTARFNKNELDFKLNVTANLTSNCKDAGHHVLIKPNATNLGINNTEIATDLMVYKCNATATSTAAGAKNTMEVNWNATDQELAFKISFIENNDDMKAAKSNLERNGKFILNC